jgi:thioredoxin 1
MGMNREYTTAEPAREEIDRLAGPTVIEFGAPWCGHCMAAQPLLVAAFADHPQVRHIKIEDGRGRPLGRSFRIKLWPTLVFLTGGIEIDRITRPDDADQIRAALNRIDGTT